MTMASPEETGRYECPACGNTRAFVGYDDHGYPGPNDCGCARDPCECEVTLAQPFAVRLDGSIDYREFEGGGFGAGIGAYTRIQCAACGELIWTEDADANAGPNRNETSPPKENE